MTIEHARLAGATVSLFGSGAASIMQVVIGHETLIPLGVAATLLGLAIGLGWKVSKWAVKMEMRINMLKDCVDKLEKDFAEEYE